MKTVFFDNYNDMSQYAAKLFAAKINEKPSLTIGLATGSTPLGLYSELADMYRRGLVDFSGVRSFNLDEYYPISRADSQSYYRFMNKNFFDLINIKKTNTHVPNGEAKDAKKECAEYEEMIEKNGGIDLQLLGIGENGHIGFNEPADELCAVTHLQHLTQSTINANSRFFESAADVPKDALTMGIGTIFSAKSIVILASGKKKKDAVAKLLSDDISTSCPVSLIKLHKNVTLLCDNDARP